MGVAEGVTGGVLGCFGGGLVIWAESGVIVLLVLLVSERENCGIATRSPLSTLSADLMGVAHFLSERRLRVDWPEFGGVGVDCTELVFAESVLIASDILFSAQASFCNKIDPFPYLQLKKVKKVKDDDKMDSLPNKLL